jgi:hypothetical protein
MHKKRLPEEDVNTSTHVGLLYEVDITVIYCAFVGLNNKLHLDIVKKKFAAWILLD